MISMIPGNRRNDYQRNDYQGNDYQRNDYQRTDYQRTKPSHLLLSTSRSVLWILS